MDENTSTCGKGRIPYFLYVVIILEDDGKVFILLNNYARHQVHNNLYNGVLKETSIVSRRL